MADIQNASFVDIHYPSSLELSLDETLNLSSSQDLDKTLTPSDVTMNTDVQDVLHLLEELADEKVSQLYLTLNCNLNSTHLCSYDNIHSFVCVLVVKLFYLNVIKVIFSKYT